MKTAKPAPNKRKAQTASGVFGAEDEALSAEDEALSPEDGAFSAADEALSPEDGALSPEDKTLWAQVTKSVEPLKGKQKRANNPKSEKTEQDQNKPPKRHKNPHATPPNTHKNTPIYDHGQAPGLDRRTQTRLRRGQISVEARLDLHGMTQGEAHDRLYHFLGAARAAGKRSVLVITGKGLRRDGEIGVLRRAVPGWLNRPPLRDWIRAFDHAAPRDGGEGALYILLRRRK